MTATTPTLIAFIGLPLAGSPMLMIEYTIDRLTPTLSGLHERVLGYQRGSSQAYWPRWR